MEVSHSSMFSLQLGNEFRRNKMAVILTGKFYVVAMDENREEYSAEQTH